MTDIARHAITRVRRETRRRVGTVSSIERLSASMLRIWCEGADFHDFESASPDDHVKIFLPGEDGEMVMRDYTPRLFDTAAGRLAIDFALHEAGPATRWALVAEPGDTLQIAGPRGSAVLADDFDWYLLVGDETALPAIGRRLEELRAGVPVIMVAIVDGPDDRLALAERPGLNAVWVERGGAIGEDAVLLCRSLSGLTLPAGEGYAWIAAESRVARAVRSHIVDTIGHPQAWTKAAGYWSAGEPGAHQRIGD